MATKAKTKDTDTRVTGKPAFPYCITPNALRRFLELIPNKPRPGKVNADTLKAWGLKNTNDGSIIRVLKAVGLVGSTNEPTERYVEFMSQDKGPAILAAAIKGVWAPLFESSHEPHKEDAAAIRNYFHVHSGGGERVIQLQIQTFKAVCDHADFKVTIPVRGSGSGKSGAAGLTGSEGAAGGPGTSIHVDLHIHLPENKTRRDYEYIFEDIARHIFGRNIAERSGE